MVPHSDTRTVVEALSGRKRPTLTVISRLVLDISIERIYYEMTEGDLSTEGIQSDTTGTLSGLQLIV